MKVRECMAFAKSVSDTYLLKVEHIFFEQSITEDGYQRDDFRTKTVAYKTEDVPEEAMEKEVSRFDVSQRMKGNKYDGFYVTIELPWEEGLVADHWDVSERKLVDEDDEEVA